MESESDVLRQWEPQMHKFLQTLPYLSPSEREDVLQDLKIATLKSHRLFDPSRGVKFHTYVYTAMLNVIRGAANKHKQSMTTSIEEAAINVVSAPAPSLDDINWSILNSGEAIILDLMLCGYNISEIERLSPGSNVRKIFAGVRKKLDRKEGEEC